MSTHQESEGEYVPGHFEDAVLLAIYAAQKSTGTFPTAEFIADYIQKAGALEQPVDVDQVTAALILLQAHGFVEDAGDAS